MHLFRVPLLRTVLSRFPEPGGSGYELPAIELILPKPTVSPGADRAEPSVSETLPYTSQTP